MQKRIELLLIAGLFFSTNIIGMQKDSSHAQADTADESLLEKLEREKAEGVRVQNSFLAASLGGLATLVLSQVTQEPRAAYVGGPLLVLGYLGSASILPLVRSAGAYRNLQESCTRENLTLREITECDEAIASWQKRKDLTAKQRDELQAMRDKVRAQL